ncbi:MAG: hypothetical protein H8E64_04130 [Candidatus Marinimicrobia bacterium]|nr:hypothetical protein [Candidatus Neomarinimicrobiota bacterium]
MKNKKYVVVISCAVLGMIIGLWSCCNPPALQVQSTEIHEDVDFSLGCTECHEEETPDIFEDWAISGHGAMNYGCYICHGDGTIEFYPEPSIDGCTSCHESAAGHLMRVENDGCFECHDGHSLEPY